MPAAGRILGVSEVRLLGGDLDGLSLHYVAAGSGPAVVLVHGLGGFAESWGQTLDCLASRATVYAVDLPGSGGSSKPRRRYDLTFFARALEAFLDAVGEDAASLVGHSLGGAVTLRLALARPARVDRLALLGATVPGFAFRPSALARLAVRPGVGEALGYLACAPVYRAALRRCFHRPRGRDVDFLVRHRYAERTGRQARAAWLATVRALADDFEVRSRDWRRAIETLDLPVLLIHGRQDRVVPPAHGVDVAASLPWSMLRWVDACGHFPQLEHPQTVNGWLAEFLVGRPAPR